MRLFVKLLLLAIMVTGIALACSARQQVYVPLSTGGRPSLIHVFNGQQLGFYTSTGSYGFGSKTNSILNLGISTIGTNQQMALDTNTGLFFLGTASCSGGCNDLIYLSSYLGFKFNNLSSSQYGLLAAGNTIGTAVNPTLGMVYVADSVNNRIIYMGENTLGYASNFTTPFEVSGSSAVTYIGSDNNDDEILITDPGTGDAFAMDGTSASQLSTSPSPMTLVGGSCTSASNLGYVAVNSGNHIAYVLCGGSVTFIKMNTIPAYYTGTLAGSNFSVTNILTATDIVVNTANNNIIVSGSHYVTALSGITGAEVTSFDLTTGNCGLASMDLEGVAYSSTTDTIYVADALNSRVYMLDATSLGFKNGSCSTSSFATPDVTSPKRISFY